MKTEINVSRLPDGNLELVTSQFRTIGKPEHLRQIDWAKAAIDVFEAREAVLKVYPDAKAVPWELIPWFSIYGGGMNLGNEDTEERAWIDAARVDADWRTRFTDAEAAEAVKRAEKTSSVIARQLVEILDALGVSETIPVDEQVEEAKRRIRTLERNAAGQTVLTYDPSEFETVEVLGYEWHLETGDLPSEFMNEHHVLMLCGNTYNYLILVRRERTTGGIRTVAVKRGELETFTP